MNTQLRHKGYGTRIDEWIALGPNDLLDDGTGLWSIVGDGIVGFGLEGEELTEYVRFCLLTVLAAGARPVKPLDGDPDYRYEIDFSYGNEISEITDNLITAWLATGGGEPEWGDFRLYVHGTCWVKPLEGDELLGCLDPRHRLKSTRNEHSASP